MSDVVYRALDRELNLNEGNKSWRGNTQSLSARFMCWRGKHTERQGRKKKRNYPQPVYQVLKDGYDGLFSPHFLSWLAS